MSICERENIRLLGKPKGEEYCGGVRFDIRMAYWFGSNDPGNCRLLAPFHEADRMEENINSTVARACSDFNCGG
jgi:hypothetical protein